MNSEPIRTSRLVLRHWRDDDLEAYAALNADPRVMEHFPSVLSRLESDQSAGRIRDAIDADGWGVWAAELVGGPSFIGFIGLLEPTFEAHFTPCVEVAWRLAFDHWNKGLATEGARASLDYAFQTLRLKEVVSMTTEKNLRSRRVMEKLGMSRNPADDFDHPRLAEDSPIRRHVLYRLAAPYAAK